MEEESEQYRHDVMQHLTALEGVAEDILTDKQQMVDLDRKRQKTREAVRLLMKDKSSRKQWVCFGNTFLQLPSDKTKHMLQNDFDQLDQEIGEIRSGLKKKVNKLRDLELREGIQGFHLNPLTKEEMKAVDALI